jgi:hypothetical protein
MRSSPGTSLVLAIVLAACDGPSPTLVAPDMRVLATRSATLHPVPFKSSSYSFFITRRVPEEGCNAGPEARVYLTGEGTATHLGNFTITFSFCSRANGTLDGGQGSFVAADGDMLHFGFTGVSTFEPPATVSFTSNATFTGGTGRFNGAAGEAQATGSVDVGTGAGSGRWEGEISRVGSQ